MSLSRSAIHCLVVSPRHADIHAAALAADAHALGITQLAHVERRELYFVQGNLEAMELARLAEELLTDAITQTYVWRNGDAAGEVEAQVIEVALRPGVTDAVATEIVRGAQALQIEGVEHAATGQQYSVRGRDGKLTEKELHTLAKRLLANDVIQRYALGEIEPSFPQEAQASGVVEMVPVTELDVAELAAVSTERRAALDGNEMRAVQKYFRNVGREPSDVEFEMIAETWSEHCVHKTFKARIRTDDGGRNRNERRTTDNGETAKAGEIDGLLRTYLRAATEEIGAPWVRSAFVDNAGILDFDDEYEVSFKVETHNHPSAVEPFGGANTGVGGVIRDVLGVSAKPIAASDVLCFGPQDLDPAQLPEGVLHPRRIRSGVVAGVQDYGNKIGIPTVSGGIYYDAGYTANPLVFCGCVGIAPKNQHPREPLPGDRVIVLGGKTGRDGLRGATFSSMTMDAQTGQVAGASVQIGDPITEKGLIEVIVRAREAGLYHAITDCGAGGLSSAIGEMASECGVEVELQDVRLKYPGLAPWEIWLSEAQERMVLAVPEEKVAALQMLCDTFEVELTEIGSFTASGHVVVKYAERVVLDLENEFLHHGIPQRELTAILPPPTTTENLISLSDDPKQTLLELLANPNTASKADVIRIYDHEVQGGTVVKPLTGVLDDGPSDAVVLKPLGTKGTRGIVLACGMNPEYGTRDAYRMARAVIDEAVRNAVAVGADPEQIALLDNFCWGDPMRPETLGTLVQAAQGCYEGARLFGAPFISGKDSLNNEYLGADGQRHAIPPTLLISAIGFIEDVNQAVTMDLKQVGDVVYRVGIWNDEVGAVPVVDEATPQVYRALHQAMRAGLVRACHDLSEGGLSVTAAEMCIGGRLGLTLNVANAADLFQEVNGNLLVEVKAEDAAEFEKKFETLPNTVTWLGRVTDDGTLTVNAKNEILVQVAVSELVRAWNPNTEMAGEEPE